jgi:hypothetical protein
MRLAKLALACSFATASPRRVRTLRTAISSASARRSAENGVP